MHQASVGFHCPECARSGRQQVYRGTAAMTTQPTLTWILVGINVAVFVAGVITGGAQAFSGSVDRVQLDFGLVARLWEAGGHYFRAAVPGSHEVGVGGGQWYRMITSGFLHYGILHIAFNMYALWILGAVVERMGGKGRLAAVYAVALVAGSLGALILTPDSFTAGASGAIFGLMGAILMAQKAHGVAFRNSPLLGVLALNLLITFGLPGISIGGHLGGLIGGGIAGWLVFDLPRRPGFKIQVSYAICVALTLALLVAGYLVSVSHTPALG